MTHEHAVFPKGTIYHLYPFGTLGAPHSQEDFRSNGSADETVASGVLPRLADWIPHMHEIGATAVLLGPIFVSETHGYDTLDLYHIDPRLGSDDEFVELVETFHNAGLSVLVDAVLNHVGRGFFAFQDLIEHGKDSVYADWFHDIDFSTPGPMGEPFSYETWSGHASLIKLETKTPAVREYLFGAISRWIDEFKIDGMRLDAADVIDPGFWPHLRQHVDEHYDPHHALAFSSGHFWMFGEMVHGDYRQVAFPGGLDSTTNFECYKGLYSSFNDKNFFEIGWSLKRQFGPEGLYRSIPLVSFVDNHDVDRIASTIDDQRDLIPLHLFLFTIPGVPTLYYGSEIGIAGVKGIDDWPLRPGLAPDRFDSMSAGEADLFGAIKRFASLRQELPQLQSGSFRELAIEHEQYLFCREDTVGSVFLAVNAADEGATITVPEAIRGVDLLADETIDLTSGEELSIPPKWGRIIAAP